LWPTTFREELKVAELFFFNCLHPKRKKRKKRTHVDDLHILQLEILHQLYEAEEKTLSNVIKGRPK
jgi:hypothetical protein